MIFTTINDLKDHVGGAVNKSMPLASLTSSYQAARRNHLERYLGADFLDELEKAVSNPPEAGRIEEVTNAINRVREPLALLTLYEYTFVGSIQHGSEGLTRQESESTKAVFKYQENNYRNWMLNTGLDALDNCLTFLSKNADDYPTWRDGDGAEYHNAVLIRSSKTLRRYHNQPSNRYAYEALRPIIADVQEFVATTLLGEKQMEELLILLEEDISPEQKRLTGLLSRAIANFSVAEGMRRNLVQLQGGRIVQTEALEPQSSERVSNPGLSQVTISAEQSKEFAERHLSRVRYFLTKNADQFPLYQEWLEANQPDPDVTYPTEPGRRTGSKIVGL